MNDNFPTEGTNSDETVVDRVNSPPSKRRKGETTNQHNLNSYSDNSKMDSLQEEQQVPKSEEQASIKSEETDQMEATPTGPAGHENSQEPSNVKKENGEKEDTSPAQPPVEPEESLPERPAEASEEKRIIKDLEPGGPKVGETWYIVSASWWRSWKDFVSYDYSFSSISLKTRPGPIDNSSIIEDGSEPGHERMRSGLMETYDFILLKAKAWKYLHHWYGGGPALPRKAIQNYSQAVIEVRLLTLKVIKSSAPNDEVLVDFSKVDTVKTLKEKMCKEMGLELDNVRVWDFHNKQKFKLLENLNSTLEEAQILDKQAILLEEKGENGKFPETSSSNSYSRYPSYSSYNNVPTDPGVSGLTNLGNTCFMNSALQCLSNTVPLTDFFLTNKYQNDKNVDNPLGSRGELAEEYAGLLKELWSGHSSVVTPRDFKWRLERFAPQFAGYHQHDSQELLAFLLDGLHEDLNRVKTKPYRELKDPDGRPDQEVADEMWEYHKSRNNSIIVDWFQGQLKSTLECPDCKKISITFDPFMYLSLPLPVKDVRVIRVTVVFHDTNKNSVKYGVEVEKSGTIKALKEKLEEMSQIKPDYLQIAEIFSNKIYKYYEDTELVERISERDLIFAYELGLDFEPQVTKEEENEEEENQTYTQFAIYSQVGSQYQMSGIPQLITISGKTITYRQLYDLIFTRLRRFFRFPPELGIIRTRGQAEGQQDPMEEEKVKKQPEGDDEQPASSSEEEREDPSKTPLFEILVSQEYSNTIRLDDTEKPLTFKGKRLTLVAKWDPSIWNKFYNNSAEETSGDSSLSPREEESINLEDCIDSFTTTEKLGPEDPWYCSRCKDHKQATKKFDLWRLPRILVVHLKRFSYKNRYYREKLETFVNYPLHNLDLSKWIGTQNQTYDLFAVSNHYGSLGGGHYTAYGKNKTTNKWYKFDDSHASVVSEDQVKSSSAYVLFYQLNEPSNNQNTPDSSAPASSSPQVSQFSC